MIKVKLLEKDYLPCYTITVMESKKPISDGSKSSKDTTGAILLTIGDTTWRMFVPSIGFTLLGVFLDGMFGTKPWLMTLGIIFGALMAFILVKRQISAIKNRKDDQ